MAKKEQNRTAEYKYRCKLCDEVSTGVCGGENFAMMEIIQVVNGGEVEQLPLKSVHRCKDGSIGITELIGVTFRES